MCHQMSLWFSEHFWIHDVFWVWMRFITLCWKPHTAILMCVNVVFWDVTIETIDTAFTRNAGKCEERWERGVTGYYLTQNALEKVAPAENKHTHQEMDVTLIWSPGWPLTSHLIPPLLTLQQRWGPKSIAAHGTEQALMREREMLVCNG